MTCSACSAAVEAALRRRAGRGAGPRGADHAGGTRRVRAAAREGGQRPRLSLVRPACGPLPVLLASTQPHPTEFAPEASIILTLVLLCLQRSYIWRIQAAEPGLLTSAVAAGRIKQATS